MSLVLFAFPAIVLIAQPIWPRVLGIFFYLNESLFRRKTLILTEYFVDQEKYSYLIMLHTDIAVIIGTFAMIATGTLLLVSLKHACGMFSIASYRIERAITNNRRENVNLKDQNVIFRRMVYAIDIHRKAMQYSNFLVSSFEGTFFLLIAFTVICLSFNFFRIFQLTSTGGDKFELLLRFLHTILILLFMFVGNAIGQELTDRNDQVYFTAYKVIWYTTSLHVQKLILFLIQRGNKTFWLKVGGLFVPCLEGFSTLINASLSYFTMIYSTQQ
ncbi:odorant receptor 43a-like [Odontomachus brunneus]|uniref:odorant receptor 43a-like n=1 Tax=Odontomachus brunneus TaxID=486640 RepID=UPI0013F28FCE|nr:odorant receptor 43a-like [Odontomachus brunneus]